MVARDPWDNIATSYLGTLTFSSNDGQATLPSAYTFMVGDAGVAPAQGVTLRTATATGRVMVSPEVVGLLRGAGVPKGDTLAVARLAGIMGAKQTPALIPLCHPLSLSGVTVDLVVT